MVELTVVAGHGSVSRFGELWLSLENVFAPLRSEIVSSKVGSALVLWLDRVVTHL